MAEMTRLEHRVEIELPPEEVFAFISDPLNDPYWETALLSGQDLGSPKAAGSKVTRVRKVLGFKSTAQITEFESDRKIGVRGSSRPLPFEGSWTFKSLPS